MDAGISARPRARSSRVAQYQPAAKGGDLGWCVLMIASILVLIYAGFVVYSARSAGGINKVTASAVSLFDKDNYEKYIKPSLPEADNR